MNAAPRNWAIEPARCELAINGSIWSIADSQ